MRRLREESGMALLAVLVVILVLSLLGGLVLHLSGQEQHLSTVRYRAAQSLNIAEGWSVGGPRRADGAGECGTPGRSGAGRVGDTRGGAWVYAEGNAAAQAPLAWLNHVVVDGGRIQPALGRDRGGRVGGAAGELGACVPQAEAGVPCKGEWGASGGRDGAWAPSRPTPWVRGLTRR
jgi:hypothetical protein